MQDKVSIGMIDIASGMSEYMGEGKPLKVVVGGNVLMDWGIAGACMINHANGVNTDSTPYIINTDVLYITTPEDADDYAVYFENPDTPILNGDQWNNTILGRVNCDKELLPQRAAWPSVTLSFCVHRWFS